MENRENNQNKNSFSMKYDDIKGLGDSLQSLIESSPDPLFTIGLNGNITDVNAATEIATGLPREKLIGTVFSAYFTEPCKAESRYQQAVKGGKVSDYKLRLKHINGYATPVLYNALLYKDDEGKSIGVCVAARDITATRKNADELDHLKNNFEQLVQQRAEELSKANKELAFQNEEKDKRAAELAIANRELAFQNEEKDKRAAELAVANRELAFQNEEKDKRAAEIADVNKELVINKEKIKELYDQLENSVMERTAQLEFANKELEAVSYSISHDLKAPLRHITGYNALLEKKYKDLLPGEGRQYLDNIFSATKNMGELIDGLLHFSKINRIGMKKDLLNMDEIVDTLVRPIKEGDIQNRIEFSINPMPPAYGDLQMMKSVWSNLIENAIKFTKNKNLARIIIGAEENENTTIYHIKDNGAGFDMNYASKLFTMFQRLHAQEDYKGTGIGLATVERLITRHGGKVWAEGKVGEGASFYFSLQNKKGKW